LAEDFPLKVFTPTGIVFDGRARQVTATGPRGEFGVLADHINFITALTPGLLKIEKGGGGVETWVISGGLAEVKDGTMTVLATGAQTPASINRAQAEDEERAANQKMATISFYDAGFPAAEEALLLARARMQASSAPSAR
jgi:F-type H+-transporting ATPase subunit epsilon